jgi:hypothetical protein
VPFALLSEAGGKNPLSNQFIPDQILNRPFAQDGSLKGAKNAKERQEKRNQSVSLCALCALERSGR